jgi:hypothetical protein
MSWKAVKTWAQAWWSSRHAEAGGSVRRQQGIVKDEKGQEQPADKARAQEVSRKDRGGDPPGQR